MPPSRGAEGRHPQHPGVSRPPRRGPHGNERSETLAIISRGFHGRAQPAAHDLPPGPYETRDFPALSGPIAEFRAHLRPGSRRHTAGVDDARSLVRNGGGRATGRPVRNRGPWLGSCSRGRGCPTVWASLGALFRPAPAARAVTCAPRRRWSSWLPLHVRNDHPQRSIWPEADDGPGFEPRKMPVRGPATRSGTPAPIRRVMVGAAPSGLLHRLAGVADGGPVYPGSRPSS